MVEAWEIVAVVVRVGHQAAAGSSLEALQFDHFEVGADWGSASACGRIAGKFRLLWGLVGVFAESGKRLERMTKNYRDNTYRMAFIFNFRVRSCPGITFVAQDVLIEVLLVIDLLRNLTKRSMLR